MACEFCHGIINHHPRCPNYELKEPSHYCSICGDGIFNGEEYIANDDGDYSHFACFNSRKKLVEWLGFEVKVMEDDYE